MKTHKNKWLMSACLCLVFPMFTARGNGQDDYNHYMDLCEKAKQAGDFEKMEITIKSALRYGNGNEYAWRSLAWAQGRQGKWKESLANARENIRRHGLSGWSLTELAEAALGNCDLALTRKALDAADKLPKESMNGCEPFLAGAREQLNSATATRIYDLHFKVNMNQGGPPEKPMFLLMPQLKSPTQSFAYKVRNAVSYKERRIGMWDYLEVVQKPGQPFFVEGRLTLRPFCLGSERLEQIPPGPCPPEFRIYLKKFQNWSWWDPELPEVKAIARTVKGKTCVETVQNILVWFRKNIRFNGNIKDDPALGQLGTILKLRYGGCHHISGLFVTLCRAAGVPACVMHGNPLPLDNKEFEIKSPCGHGWAEVFINQIGWVQVDPEDINSLRMFSVNRAYMFIGASNRPPRNHYFDGSIKCNGKEYRVFTIQHCEEIKGRLIEIQLPKPEPSHDDSERLLK